MDFGRNEDAVKIQYKGDTFKKGVSCLFYFNNKIQFTASSNTSIGLKILLNYAEEIYSFELFKLLRIELNYLVEYTYIPDGFELFKLLRVELNSAVQYAFQMVW